MAIPLKKKINTNTSTAIVIVNEVSKSPRYYNLAEAALSVSPG